MLWNLKFEGWLSKRGFSYRMAWKRRRVQLAGRMISYFTSQDDQWKNKPRGNLELTKNTSVESCYGDEFAGRPYCFRVFPGGAASACASADSSWIATAVKSLFTSSNDKKVWLFEANTEMERDAWISAIKRSIALINRVEAPPTLSGVGSIHDHYCIGDVVGLGRFGFVREAVARFTQEKYAVKAVNKTKNVGTTKLAKVLGNEIRIMRKVTRATSEHPGLCTFSKRTKMTLWCTW